MFPVPAPFGVVAGHLAFEKGCTHHLSDVRHVDAVPCVPRGAARLARPERGTSA